MTTPLEIIRATKQLLLEERQKRPHLFSKLLASSNASTQKVTPVQTAPPRLSEQAQENYVFKPDPHAKKISTVAPNENLKEPLNIANDHTSSTKPVPEALNILSFSSLRQAIEKSCPSIRLKEEIPSDEVAIQRKNAWKRRGFDVEVLLIGFGKEQKQKLLLENIAKAVSTLEKRCQVIDAFILEKERSWDSFLELPNLSFIIAPPLESWQAPILKSLIKLHPSSGKTYLGKAEVFFMPLTEQILADSTIKPRLWQTLCQKLGSQV